MGLLTLWRSSMIYSGHAKGNDKKKNTRNGVPRPENYDRIVTGQMSVTLREGLDQLNQEVDKIGPDIHRASSYRHI